MSPALSSSQRRVVVHSAVDDHSRLAYSEIGYVGGFGEQVSLSAGNASD